MAFNEVYFIHYVPNNQLNEDVDIVLKMIENIIIENQLVNNINN